MSIVRGEAVILARLDFSETSQILVLFTREHGKVRAIAKGIKRGTKTRFAAGVDLLDIGTVCFTNRTDKPGNLATVTEWKQTRSLSGLRETLPRIQCAQYVAEITAQLTEDFDPHTELFDSIIATLETLADAAAPVVAVTHFQMRLLGEIGSLPRFDSCMSCSREDDLIHFSSLQGGMICRHCEPEQIEKWEVSTDILPAVVELAKIHARDRHPQPCHPTRAPDSDAKARAIFGLLNYHIAHLIGRQPHLAASLATPSRSKKAD